MAGAPEEALARRGAHWTFDAEAFVRCVRAVREAPVGAAAAAAGGGAEGGIPVPTFAHGVGDPVQGGVTVMPHHQIVLVEGSYLLLGEGATSCLQQRMCAVATQALLAYKVAHRRAALAPWPCARAKCTKYALGWKRPRHVQVLLITTP